MGVVIMSDGRFPHRLGKDRGGNLGRVARIDTGRSIAPTDPPKTEVRNQANRQPSYQNKKASSQNHARYHLRVSPVASHRLATVQVRVDTGIHLVEKVRLVRAGRIGSRTRTGHVSSARMVSRSGQSGGARVARSGGARVTRTSGTCAGGARVARSGGTRVTRAGGACAGGARVTRSGGACASGARVARTRRMMARAHMRVQLLGRDGGVMTVRQVSAWGRKTAGGPRGAASKARTAQTTTIYSCPSAPRGLFQTARRRESLTAVRIHARVGFVGQVGRMRTVGVMAGSGQASTGGVPSARQATTVCHASVVAAPSRSGRLTAIGIDTRVGLVGQVGRVRSVGMVAGSGQAGSGGVSTRQAGATGIMMSARQATTVCLALAVLRASLEWTTDHRPSQREGRPCWPGRTSEDHRYYDRFR